MKYAIAAHIVFVVFASTFACAAELPRSIGPITLGMTPAEFKQATGVGTEPCPRCDANEEYAYAGHITLKGKLPPEFEGHGVEVFFFKGLLYKISVEAQLPTPDSAKEYFAKFGKTKDIKSSPDEANVYRIWEDKKTKVTILYDKGSINSFVMYLRDLDLSFQHYSQERSNPTNPEAH